MGDRFDRLGGAAAIASEPGRDALAHADKALSFDMESYRDQASTQPIRGADPDAGLQRRRTAGSDISDGSRLPNGPGSGSVSPRVDAVPHIVERGESFWTISRLYYNSGRYYRALWKANVRKVPKIDGLHVNDVIVIPPVEELDAEYIDDPPRVRSALSGGGRATPDTRVATTAPVSRRRESLPTARTTRTSRSGSTPDSSASDPDRPEAVLNLPVGDIGLRGRRSRGATDENDEDSPDDRTEYRTTARPRASAPVRRPIYKVRRYDTLRSIARDTLGDPRRAREILELNRDIIADPTSLITGQLIELPEDADTGRVTSRDRN
jgi:nucleoid-associated protein YgaU